MIPRKNKLIAAIICLILAIVIFTTGICYPKQHDTIQPIMVGYGIYYIWSGSQKKYRPIPNNTVREGDTVRINMTTGKVINITEKRTDITTSIFGVGLVILGLLL